MQYEIWDSLIGEMCGWGKDGDHSEVCYNLITLSLQPHVMQLTHQHVEEMSFMSSYVRTCLI